MPPFSGGSADPHVQQPPVPREELVEPMGTMVVDATKDVGEPSLRINVVEAGGLDQRVHEGGASPAAVGAGEQPCLTTEGNPTQGALRGIVREANTTVIEEAREGRPSL